MDFMITRNQSHLKSLATILFTICFLAFTSQYSAQVTAGKTVNINFEKFPGPDGILGTADDVTTAVGNPISNQYSSVGATFSLTDGGFPQIANPGGVFASFSRILLPRSEEHTSEHQSL